MSKRITPYLHRVVNRHRKIVWYVWRRPGPKIRIRGDYGSKEFMAAYRAALYGEQAPQPLPTGLPSDRIELLIAAYITSPPWKALAPATQRQRRNIFDRLCRVAGNVRPDAIGPADIKQRRDELGPGAAKHFVQTMRGLFQWAKEMEIVETDPTENVKVARPQTEGFRVWSEEEISRYEARWPVGSRERLWLACLLFTGLRRGDAVTLSKEHIIDGVISIQTGKTGAWVHLPILPALQEIIDASPTGETTLIATKAGKPMTKESFGNLFREACKAAGVPGAAHGLRKAGATRAAEAGATIHELNALFGWDDNKTASIYTKKADRKRLAMQAIGKMERK
jgi:integrase